MTKYERLKQDLETKGTGKMKAFGNSMVPILKSGSLLTFERKTDYQIGDIVFCRVKSRYIDAHKVFSKDSRRGYLIGNNHGFENGWTHQIFGKAIQAEWGNEVKHL